MFLFRFNNIILFKQIYKKKQNKKYKKTKKK